MLNSSGSIYLGLAPSGQSIETESGLPVGTSTTTLNDYYIRQLARNTSTGTQITIGDFYNKQRFFKISSSC